LINLATAWSDRDPSEAVRLTQHAISAATTHGRQDFHEMLLELFRANRLLELCLGSPENVNHVVASIIEIEELWWAP
jgi:hypothetical protein